MIQGNNGINVDADTSIYAQGLGYGVNTGSYQLVPSNAGTIFVLDSTNGSQLATYGLNMTQGLHYTIFALGIEGGTPAPWIGVTTDIPFAPVSGEGQFRFANFCGALNEAVDVYLTLPGDTTALSTHTPYISNTAYGTCTGYYQYSDGSYIMRVTPAGSTSTVLIDAEITISSEKAYTLVEYDASSTTAQLQVLDDN
jgi:hypothetical protein